MSYVRANTAPVFGMRSQALSPMQKFLGYYFKAGFPLPTTGMSQPLRLSGLGSVVWTRGMGNPGGAFYDGPYPTYPQQEVSRTRSTATQQLNGEYVPPSPPGRALFEQGAVTYRINPQTGKYEFHSTDLLPRGVFQQNTFQHPVRSGLSSLGVPIGTRGTSLVQIGGRNVVMHTTPRARRQQRSGGLFGDGCACKGSCGGCSKGLGDLPAGAVPYGVDDTTNATVYIGTDGTLYDMAGNVITNASNITTASALQNAGVIPSGSSSALQQAANALSQVNNAVRPPVLMQPASSLFSGYTSIAGQPIPNVLLFGAAAIAVMAIAKGSGGRR